MDKDEVNDFYEALLEIKSVYNSPIFLCGVSAGANHGAKLIASYG